jgi:hypothetical protein
MIPYSRRTKTTKSGERRKRGFWLKVYLLYALALQPLVLFGMLLCVAVLALIQQLDLLKGNLQPGNLVLTWVFIVWQIVCAYGLWKWKKWGAYGLLFNALAGIVVSFFLFQHFSDWNIGSWIFQLVIFGFLLRPYWEYLD